MRTHAPRTPLVTHAKPPARTLVPRAPAARSRPSRVHAPRAHGSSRRRPSPMHPTYAVPSLFSHVRHPSLIGIMDRGGGHFPSFPSLPVGGISALCPSLVRATPWDAIEANASSFIRTTIEAAGVDGDAGALARSGWDWGYRRRRGWLLCCFCLHTLRATSPSFNLGWYQIISQFLPTYIPFHLHPVSLYPVTALSAFINPDFSHFFSTHCLTYHPQSHPPKSPPLAFATRLPLFPR
ncbi:hypothetical protein K438DRAFT_1776022 [Mycena galopus ATCC 62051]|nr:hypothetical protein K438DRAFT_1776022 [Mycena galopus ATCC 62051]